MSQPRLPNFLVIGAAKAGTTSLYFALRQHPQVFMSPNKEPRFFAFEGEAKPYDGPRPLFLPSLVTDLDTYRNLFANAEGETAIGECSTLYLYHPYAPERIRRHVPRARLVAILRNPADRAFSHYTHYRRDRFEPLADMASALAAEESRLGEGWGPHFAYKGHGFYHEQLRRYLKLFDLGQIRVYLYEDWKREPIALLKDLYGFLGVDENHVPDLKRAYNVSGIPRHPGLHAFLTGNGRVITLVRKLLPAKIRSRTHAVVDRFNLRRPVFPPALRESLVGLYRDDVLRLQDLLRRDLSSWLLVDPR